VDYRLERKFSALGFCSGAVVGLVAITPASGYVGPAASVAIGSVSAVICNFGCKLKHALDYDDALDVFAVHGIGGFCGDIMTGFFAEKYIAGLDGTVIPGGWLDGNWWQVAYQLADGTAGMSWSFFVTYGLLWIMDKIPGLSLRVDINTEIQGLDIGEMGELAYFNVDKIITIDPNTHEAHLMEQVRDGKEKSHKIQHYAQFNNV